MTTGDRLAFAQAFNRLAVATRLPTHEADAAMQQVYWTGLVDLPLASVSAAAEALAKGAQWFPKVAEWRDAAYQQQVAELVALPAGREREWTHECATCEDTGWEERRCYPGTLHHCGRELCAAGSEHRKEHTYVVRCPCRDTNRTYQRHHRVPLGRQHGR